MKKIDYEHFSRFSMLHSVKVRGEECYFAVKRADMNNNCYTNDLYRYDAGGIRRMTALGDMGAFRLTDSGIVFPAKRTKDEKKQAESGVPQTVFYRMPYDGGEAVPELTVPYDTSELIPDGKGRFFFVASEDLLYLDKLTENDGDAEKAAAAMKAEEDYHVADEIPFWLNGAGFINRKRGRLYLSENGEYRAITPTHEDVSVLCSLGDRLLLCVTDMSSGKYPLYDRLVCIDKATLKRTDISFSDTCCHYSAYTLPDGRTAAFINRTDRFGLNQNPSLMLYENGTWTEVYGAGECSFTNSVGSDVKAEGRSIGTDLPLRDNMLWQCDTCVDHTAITGIDITTGTLRRINSNGMNICSMDLADNGFIISALEGSRGTELYRMDMNGNTEKLTAFNEELTEDYEYGTPAPLSVTNECGTVINGWVIPPADYEKGKKYPAILDIHGGPKTVYGSCYFHEMQLWSSMGYFVFFCNPTGGDGGGDSFADIRGHYGDQDYRDIMLFTDAVLDAYPDIRSDRVGVTGGSYGGFMTNWIIGHTGRFAAAASQRSISNWISFYNTSDIGWYFAQDQTAGNPWTAHDNAWNQSPLKYADRVTTPTLFIHSEEDYRCPLSEGVQMFNALRSHGVEARMCIFKGENHELSRSGKPLHRVRRLKEITVWFEKYLKE